MALRKSAAENSDQQPKRTPLRSVQGGGETSEPAEGHLSLVPPSAYGPDSEQPSIGPDLDVLQGGGETSEPKRGHLSSIKGGEDDDSDMVDPSQLSEAEGGGAKPSASPGEASEQSALSNEGQIGDGFQDKPGKAKGKSKATSKKNLIIGGVIATVLFGSVGILLYLPTLAVKHLMSNFKQAFNDRIEYAINNRAETYVNKYLAKVVAPSLNTCGTVVSRTCTAVPSGTGLAGRVFTSWRNNNVEEKLINRYGLSFEKNLTDPNKVKVFKTDSLGKKTLVGTFGDHTVTKEVTGLMQNMTQSGGVRDRWQIRSLLESKYRAKKWCFIACKKKDQFGDIKFSALRRLKLKIIASIVAPRNEKAATYLLCFVVDCGSPEALEKKADEAASRLINNVGGDTLQQIATEIGDKTISQYLQEKALEAILKPIMGEGAGTAAATAVPIAGQIYLAATIADFLDRIDTAIADKQLTQYVRKLNEGSYAQYYAFWNVLDDDIQSGESNAEDVGAAVQIIQGSGTSRIFSQMTGSSTLPNVQCADGVVLQGHSAPLACPEKKVQPVFFLEEWRNSEFGQIAASIINVYGSCLLGTIPGTNTCTPPGFRPRSLIRPLLKGINFVLGSVSGAILSVLSSIPGLGSLIDAVTGALSNSAGKLFSWAMTKLFPQVINADAEDQEAVDQVAASFDVTNNAFAKGEQTDDGFVGMGAPRVTPAQEAALDTTIQQQQAKDWQQKSMFARYFDTNDSRSLASKAVTNLAFDLPNFVQKPFSFNIFSTAATSFASLFSSHAHAAPFLTSRSGLFGVTQYAFPVTDPVFALDPDALTDTACAQYKANRETSSVIDPDTKEKIYTTSDPCALDETVVGGLTKMFNLDPATAVVP